MNPPDIDQALHEAAAALKRGQKAEARALLLQVVEADETRVDAWLWLSAAVEDRQDQITALENVLALDPQHSAALKGLAQLRGGEAPPPAEPPPAAYGRPGPIESVHALDDPYQCLYCGAPAPAELRRCPECGRGLMMNTGRSQMSDSLRNAANALILVISLTAAGAILVSVFIQGGAFNNYLYDHYPFLGWLVGDFRAWTTRPTVIVQAGQYASVVVLLVVLLGLAYQLAPAYYAAAGLLSLNLLWLVFCWLEGYLGPVLAALTGAASVVALALLFAAQPDFRVNPVRRRCAVDSRIKGGEPLHRLGHIAKNNGEWALAVAYWRAAVAAAPNRADFYKDLAIGYAQIGHYARAFKALDEFARLAADPSDFTPMQTLIRQKQTQDPAPRG
jgi:tetratricopeptide (TPR) repeat protein